MDNRKRIAFITSGRSDYALIRPLLRRLKEHDMIEPWVIATGAHMTKYFGKTIQEIEHVNDRVDILMQSNNQVSVANSIGLGLIKFSEVFIKRNFRAMLLMGDRFEVYSAGVAAFCLNIPIIHAYGGETTFGSKDDGWRNSLTVFAEGHLVSHEIYAARVRQIKTTDHDKIRVVGSLSVDNIKETPTMERQELSARIKAPLQKYLLVTFHPDTTLGRDENISDFQEFLAALDRLTGYDIIITFANQDSVGVEFNRMIMEFKGPRTHVKYIRSAGVEMYLSLVKHAEAVVGNSSSGIMEAPYFGTPTVNVGRRQEGRILAESVTTVPCRRDAIIAAVINSRKRKPCGIFGDGAAENIVKYLEEVL